MLYKQQCQHTLKSGRESTAEFKRLVFNWSLSPYLVGPMFQSIWGHVLAVFTLSFEVTEDVQTIERCLLGLQLSLNIASLCNTEEAIQILVDSFAKFTRPRTA